MGTLELEPACICGGILRHGQHGHLICDQCGMWIHVMEMPGFAARAQEFHFRTTRKVADSPDVRAPRGL